MSEGGVKNEAATFDRDSVGNTLLVAISLSLVCSILVASVSVFLKPIQEQNEKEFRQNIILEVAGLPGELADSDSLSEILVPHLVELESGDYTDVFDAADFDPVAAANESELSVTIPGDLDIGNIRRRSKYAPVFLVMQGNEVEQIILPIYGSGLWSTMHGFLALASDANTVTGMRFYSHAETPGLGDQIDAADWREQWIGKQIFDDDGVVRFEVVRGAVQTGTPQQQDDARFQVDGLSGATLTGRGVSNLVRYWTGPHGFGPYLGQIRAKNDD